MQRIIDNHIDAIDPQSSPIIPAEPKCIHTWCRHGDLTSGPENIVIAPTTRDRMIERPVPDRSAG